MYAQSSDFPLRFANQKGITYRHRTQSTCVQPRPSKEGKEASNPHPPTTPPVRLVDRSPSSSQKDRASSAPGDARDCNALHTNPQSSPCPRRYQSARITTTTSSSLTELKNSDLQHHPSSPRPRPSSSQHPASSWRQRTRRPARPCVSPGHARPWLQARVWRPRRSCSRS